MNRIYRVVFNTQLGLWQAVCECARGRGKSRSAARALGLAALLGAAVLPVAWADGGSGGIAFGSNAFGGGVDRATDVGGAGAGGGLTAHGGGGGGAGISGGNGGGDAGGAGGVNPGDNGANGERTNGSGGGGGGGAHGSLASNATGGRGGDGANANPAYGAGGGGGGGAGGYGAVLQLGAGLSESITQAVQGGNGGNGGEGATSGRGGSGGSGGVGLWVDGAANASVSLNTGLSIQGGNGGNGTNSSNGGNGGNGVSGSDIRITNSGTINGGNGGNGGNGSSGGSGGSGISGSDLTITNNGAINGGVNGGTVQQANAITVTSGSNSLTSNSSATYGGGIAIQQAGTTLILDQTSTAGATSGFHYSNSFTGNGRLVVQTDTDKTVTLSGANTYSGGTILNAGTLVVGSDTALGTGALTVDGAASLSSNTGVVVGNDIALNAALRVLGSQNIGLEGAISGTGSLTKDGSATLTLSGANTYTGGTTINAGTLVVGSDTALGTGALTIDGAASLSSNTGVVVGNDIALNAALRVLGSQGIALEGAISGAGSLTKDGSATLTLSGANTYTGGTTINNGTLAIGPGGSLSSTGAVNLAGAGASFDISASVSNQSIGSLAGVADSHVALGGNSLALGVAADTTYSGTISGSGGITKNGSGVQTLTGANTFSGGVALNAGGLLVGNTAALGSGALTVGGNSTLDSNAPLTLGNNMVLNAGLTVLGSNDLTLNGNLSGTGSLTKDGAATLTLNGTNAYTGGTTINAGTLALGAGASLHANGIVNLASGATFDLSAGAGTQTFGTLIGNGAVNLGANTLTIGNATNGAFSGAVAGSGGLIKEGTGTQTLTGASTFTGGTTINAGTLAIGAGGSLAATGAVVLANAGTGFDISAGGNQSIGSLAGAAGSTVTLGASTLTLGGVGNSSFSGAVDGTGSLVKNGAGVQTLNGANIFSGGVALNAGGLLLGNNAALGTGALNVGGAVTLEGTSTLSVGNSINLGMGGSLNVLGGQPLTLGGVIAGNGSLVKNGAATLTLTNANTYTGGTTIDSGTLAIGSGGSLAATGAVSLSGAGTTLDISAGGNQTVGALSGVAGSTLALGSNTLTFGDATSQTLAGAISGTGGLVKQGAGTQTLTGANTYTGGTTVSGGTLALGSGGSLSSSTALQVGAGATFDISAASSSQTVGSLAGAGTLTLGSNSLDTGANNQSTTFSGSMTGTGGLNKTGTGTLTLAGGNTFSGNTAVNGGSLVMAAGSSLASSQVAVANGASLGGSGSLSGHVTVATGATLAPGASNGTGSLTVGSLDMNQGSTLAVALGTPGANFQTPGQGTSVSVTGDLALSGVTLSVTDAGGFGPGLYRLFDYGGTLTTSNGGFTAIPINVTIQSLTASKQINLINTQGLTLNLWNANGLASSTAMGGGSGTWSNTAAAWTDATGSPTAAMSPQPGFAIFGGAAGTVTVDSVAGAVQAIGLQFASDGYHLNGDALTLVADAGYAGPVEVRVGDGSGASSTWTATLDNVLAGTDGLKKTGAGTLVLNGSNTYSGGTTIAAGTLSVSSDHNLGSSADTLTLGGGTVQVTGTAFTGNGSRTWLLGSAGGGIDIADAANSFTLSSDLTGNGSLFKTGAGTLTLTGSNNYSGTTTIDGGKLVASVANLGSGAITNNAALELNQGSDAAMAQAISGNGSFTKTGVGTLTLAGANTATGETIISAGGLVASVANLASGAITNNAALELNQTSDATLAQQISGNGSLTKTGAGVLTLTGNSSSYAGSTLIANGSLLLGSTGQLGGNVTVANGATLTGTGNVGSTGSVVTVQSGATIAARDASSAYGTLRVAGDLVLEQGASYQVQADPHSSASSLIKVAGTATLGGSVLHVGNESNAATDFQVGKTYTILEASQINGTFSSATSNYAYLDATLGYLKTGAATTDVTLQLQRKGSSTGGGNMGFADLADTRNQSSAAGAIESLGRGNPLFDHIETLPQGTPAAVLASVSGDTHAGVQGSLVGLGAHAPGLSSKHLLGNLTAGMYAGAPVAQSDGALPASAWPSSKALPAWAEVVGHWQRYDGDGNAAQLKQRTTGLFLGMDQEVGTSGWRLGGSVGYTNASGKVADRSSESDVNSYSAAVYGGKSFGTGTGPRINVLGGLAYTWHDIETTRKVQSLGQTLKADYSAHTAQLFAEVGYAIGQYDKVGFEPFVGVSLGQQRTGSFHERGGFAALQGRSNTDDLASTTLGMRVHSDFQLAGKEGRLRATVGWRHAFGDVATEKTMAFEGGQNFTVAGAPLARNTAVLGLEADVALSRSAALVLGYQGEMGSGQRDHSASVKLRWAF